VKNHVSHCKSASVRETLPAGTRENAGVVRVMDAMLIKDILNRIGSAIRVEVQSIIWLPFEVSKEPDKGVEVKFTRTDACFCKFKDRETEILLQGVQGIML
jgi:hypothetical protein